MFSRQVEQCFSLWIPLNEDSDTINQMLKESLLIEEFTRKLLNQEISVSDFFDATESCEFDIDQYIDEVELNVIDLISSTTELTKEDKGLILYGL